MTGRPPTNVVRAKVVLVGAPAVGKTSLIRRFVHQVFSDQYRSTLGVKVDRKAVTVGDSVVQMLLWDTHGEGDGLEVPSTYLNGAAAAVAVFDASRPESVRAAEDLASRVQLASSAAQITFVANKSDLVADRETGLHLPGVVETSAKTGDGVDEMFRLVAHQLVV